MASLPADLDRLLHDLRGPLNAMVMHLEILKRQSSLDVSARASLDVLQQEVGRLAVMLPAAFEVLALEPGLPEVVNLRTLVERVLKDEGWREVTLVEGAWPEVRGDAALLGLAVAQLVRNALEATREAGPDRPPPCVGFESRPPDHVSLVIRDSGKGLRTTNPRALIRLAAGRAAERKGTGLVTVERIARLHGGGLEFKVAPSGGAEVRLVMNIGGGATPPPIPPRGLAGGQAAASPSA